MTNSLASLVAPASHLTPLEGPLWTEVYFNNLMAIMDRKVSSVGNDGFDKDLPEGWDEGLVRLPVAYTPTGLLNQAEGGCLVEKVQA